MLLALHACSDGNSPGGPTDSNVSSIAVTATVDTLTAIDQGLQLTAVARDRQQVDVPNPSLEWTSSHPTIIAVNATGRVVARAAGSAVITAKAGAASGNVTLHVKQLVAKVAVSPGTWSPSALGQQQQLTVLLSDANNHPVLGALPEWVISDSSIASITTTGLATALANGTTSLTASASGKSAGVAVQVRQVVSKVVVAPDAWNPVALGLQQQFTAAAEDANGHPVTDWEVVWSTSDTARARITASGVATAVGPGAATVTATTTGAIDVATVLVAQTVATMEVTPARDTLRTLGATRQLQATASDPNGQPIAGIPVAWTSSNPAVLTVSASGLATAVTNGTAVVTATAGTATDHADMVVAVSVAPQFTDLHIEPQVWTATALGNHQQFNVWARNANGDPVDVPPEGFTSLAPSIVTVDSRGLVTAVGEGRTGVIVTAGGMVDTAVVTVDRSGITTDGVVWSVYFAREIESPAYLLGGRVRTPLWADGELWPAGNVTKFEFVGPRVGILTDVFAGLGTFRVRDKIGEWVDQMIGNVRDFQLEGNRMAVLTGDGTLLAKNGVTSSWGAAQATNVERFQLEDNRIGVLTTTGAFMVRDGLTGAFSVLGASGVAAFQLEGNRIGILKDDGDLMVKDGIQGAWTTVTTSVKEFQLGGNRIGAIHHDGRWRVKDGPAGTWHTLASSGVKKFQFEGSRIGELSTSGRFRVKTGIQGEWWNLGPSGIKDFQLQGNRVALLHEGDRLRIKNGSLSATWEFDETYPGLTQWDVAVAVRAESRYTTATGYAAARPGCQADPLCQDYVRVPALIEGGHVTFYVPFYGYHCGKDRPLVNQSGSGKFVDAMDWVCRHHDKVGSWYADGSANGTFGACIVKYAIRNSRMTVNGTLAPVESGLWWAAWGMMPKMFESMVAFDYLTSLCTESQLEEFVATNSLGL